MPESASRVGIVVRTKNRPELLARALNDIAAQDFASWIVRIVDDGGDAAAVDAVIASLSAEVRHRIEVSHNTTSRGRSAAANQGVAALDTEFIVLHDDDDLWHPAFLSCTVAWLDANPADIGVAAKTEIVYEEQQADGRFAEVGRAPFWSEVREITYSDLLAVNRFVPIAYLYRRSLHEEVGLYREDIHAAEDWEFNLRTAVGHHIGLLDGPPLAFWMQRVGVGGELGNSMFALADEHVKFDRLIRDEALREYASTHGPGLALYLTSYIDSAVREAVRGVVREELARELDSRPSDLQRLARRVRRWVPGRRTAGH